MVNLKERHKFWWDILCNRVWLPLDFDKSLPGFEITSRLSKTAGFACYRESKCIYNINYAIDNGQEYDNIICHELCHLMAYKLDRKASHCTLWRYLYNVVCCQKRDRYHSYRLIVKQEHLTQPMRDYRLLETLRKKLKAANRSN